MGIRSGRSYLESLRDGRVICIDGELARDVTADKRFAGAARTIAELYDMQGDVRMTFPSPRDGAPVGLSYLQPRTVEDLVRRREMVKVWADATCGMMGRSPDFMNVMVTGFASAADAFAERGKQFGDNVRISSHCATGG